MNPQGGRGRWAVVLLSAPVAWWLFSDTIHHYVPADAATGSLRFSYWGSIDDKQMWDEIIGRFESSEPQWRIHAEWLPLYGYATKLDQQFVAEEAPDIILFQDEPFPSRAREQFTSLDEYLANDLDARGMLEDCWPTARTSFMHNGSLRGLPIMGGNVLVFCNLDAFDRAARARGEAIELPANDWTLDDFVSLAVKLTVDLDGDGRTDQFGFMQPQWVYYLPFIWSHGATLLDESLTRWTFMGPEAIASLSMFADLRHRWRVTPLPSEYAGQNFDTAFLSGRVAMCMNGPWFEQFLMQTGLKLRHCVAPIPRGPGGSATRVTWDALCIYDKSSPGKKEAAWRFLKSALSDSAQASIADRLRAVPARISAAERFVRAGGGQGSPAAKFVDAMNTGRLQPITEHWETMSRPIARHVTSLLFDGPARRTPEQVVEALQSDTDIQRCFGK
jgi:multiple sugar transport system substrate-binding protein